jgi:ubiquinone/menaquinone biosynthesis C-methylase UbiE
MFKPISILDVGGRKSPYTVGLPARITLLDIPRQTETQATLHLGVTEGILGDLQRYRSNIYEYVLQDMTKCTLPSRSFDGVVCIEVIEHVRDDESLITQVFRVLKPGGWLYLTTPNGDYVRNKQPNYNPDHFRHYTRKELHALLTKYFKIVKIRYGIRTGKHRYIGLQSMNIRQPTKLLKIMANNVINHFESVDLEHQSSRTAHLFAFAHKTPDS